VRDGKRGAIKWLPHAEDDTPQEGFVIITTDRDRTVYAVTGFPTSMGRGFFLGKLGGKDAGTDKRRAGYSVVCAARGPEGDHCECAGFSRWGWCKHSDCCRTLLMNGWV
jgi:hypothetical protein